MTGKDYVNRDRSHTGFSTLLEKQRDFNFEEECLRRYSASRHSFLSWLNWKCNEIISFSSFDTATSKTAILERSSLACANMKFEWLHQLWVHIDDSYKASRPVIQKDLSTFWKGNWLKLQQHKPQPHKAWIGQGTDQEPGEEDMTDLMILQMFSQVHFPKLRAILSLLLAAFVTSVPAKKKKKKKK